MTSADNQFQEHEFERASIPALVAVLNDEESPPERRGDAACALGDRLRNREIQQFDDAVLEALEACLQDPVFAVRFEAAIALAEAQHPHATEVLLQATDFRSLRLDAIRALGKGGDAMHATAPLLKLIRRFLLPWADKLQAAAALCALGNVEGQRYLENKLTSRKTAERAAAIHFIGESGHPRAFDILSAIAGQASPMQDVAIRALGFVGDHRTLPFLQQAKQGAVGELGDDIEEAIRLQNARPE